MSSRKERKRIVEYIYGEMPADRKNEFEAMMKRTPDLKKNIEDFKTLRNSLKKWKVADSPKTSIDPLMVYRGMESMKKTHSAGFPLWSKIAFGAGVLMILFAFLNLNVAISDKGFSISFGKLSSTSSFTADDKISETLDNNNQQLLNVVRGYIAESDQKQIDAIVKLIRDSEVQAAERRKFELNEIYSEIANLKLNTNNYLVSANQAIQGLFQYINDINPQRPNSTAKGI
jgi:hypothetical protein